MSARSRATTRARLGTALSLLAKENTPTLKRAGAGARANASAARARVNFHPFPYGETPAADGGLWAAPLFTAHKAQSEEPSGIAGSQTTLRSAALQQFVSWPCGVHRDSGYRASPAWSGALWHFRRQGHGHVDTVASRGNW